MTTAAQDDEMFMDPSSMGDMVSIDTGLPLGEFIYLYNYLRTICYVPVFFLFIKMILRAVLATLPVM